MKIDLRQIPPEGLRLRESCDPKELDLEAEDIKFKSPIQIEAKGTKIVNSVTVDAYLSTEVELVCSRCLETFTTRINKKKSFNYSIPNDNPVVDISEDVRQELILDYPIKILCKPDCKGLCQKCGTNLNLEQCNCK
ncbi:MAG: DUF177 domain-containing protein [Candidatus Omnitrophica bacterium]|nr:DUF177 domain-containing protein [Candidatus Omnitrophota bacterium]